MSIIKIRGGTPLRGEVYVHGSKNAALPILAAAYICGGESVIHNCPDIGDVRRTISILEHLGCRVKFADGTVTVTPGNCDVTSVPDELMRPLRSSVIFAGALLAKTGKAEISYPGGCKIGHRPIDLHLNTFRKLGIIINEEHGRILCDGSRICPTRIFLDFPSVGATENIILATVTAQGTTTIVNAAKEPEILDLQNFLNSMGADIRGGGTDVIEITGVPRLGNCEHCVIPDRIVASTYMAAVVASKGSAEIRGIVPNHVSAFIAVMRECGASVTVKGDSLRITSPKSIRPIKLINTMPYPGFPTDAQSIIMSVMATAKGTGIIRENIFQGRYTHANELVRMGADISIADKIAVVRGVRGLSGCEVCSADLRSGAALAVAALGAEGETTICNVGYIDRGYEGLEKALSSMGAFAERIDSVEEIGE